MSKIKADTVETLAGANTSMANVVNGSAKAWVNFNGTGTVAIRQAYNVSTITDNGVGDYTVNFTTPMVDANYAVSANIYTMGNANVTENIFGQATLANGRVAPTASNFRVAFFTGASNLDSTDCLITVFR